MNHSHKHFSHTNSENMNTISLNVNYFDNNQTNQKSQKNIIREYQFTSEQSRYDEIPRTTHYDEEYNVDETLDTQQSSRPDQNSYLEQINEIFETFEASMRTCPTSPDFVCCLVNLHQNSTKCICSESGKKCSIQCGQTLEQLLKHINALQTSFTKFAASSKPFQSLLQSDQNELLKKNGLMFVMVSLQIDLLIISIS